MDRIFAAQVFVEIAERGSLTAAAEALGISRASASRYIDSFEAWAQGTLLDRTTRRTRLTILGEEVLRHSRDLLAITSTIRSAAATDEARGVLRFSSVTFVPRDMIAEVATEFTERYPGTSLDIWIEGNQVDLLEGRLDFAIQTSGQIEDNLIARRLATLSMQVCAAPSYLERHGIPQDVEDFHRHNFLIPSASRSKPNSQASLPRLSLLGPNGYESVRVHSNLVSNDFLLLRRAAVHGDGILVQPEAMIYEWVGSGHLVPLPHLRHEPVELFIVYASRRRLPAAARAMLELLIERLGERLPFRQSLPE